MINTRRIDSASGLESCLAIRRKVFIEEQNVPEADEMDGLEGESEHYLLKVDQTPAGTARVRYLGKKAKIERVAILKEYRGKGLGKKIMQYIIEEIITSKKVAQIMLGAQIHAIPFYESIGFTVCSEEYMDAGIAHKDMRMWVAKR